MRLFGSGSLVAVCLTLAMLAPAFLEVRSFYSQLVNGKAWNPVLAVCEVFVFPLFIGPDLASAGHRLFRPS